MLISIQTIKIYRFYLISICTLKTADGGGGEASGGALHDAVLGQVAQLHVPKGFPRTDHRDVRAQTLHPWDVVAKAGKQRSF